MEKSEKRLQILKKITELEKRGLWHSDVEDDPITKTLLPDQIDYLNKKLSSKILTFFANRAGTSFFEKLIKNNKLIIDKVVGIEHLKAISGGAIITCNHFSPCDNYAVWKAIRPHIKGKLYKVIREGNYTNPPAPYGFVMRHCNTLPLSSDAGTMKKFLRAIDILLSRGEKILVYPEQSMWWNYRKPRPLKSGAFKFAVKNNVPVLPIFITMEDSEFLDDEGYAVQKLTLNILPAIYPSQELSFAKNVEKMKNENYQKWVEVYEKTYKTPLKYTTKEDKK